MNRTPTRVRPDDLASMQADASAEARLVPPLPSSTIERRRLPRMPIVDRVDFILRRCGGRTVLHLGAVDYSNEGVCGLHRELMKVSKQVVGIDNDRDGINAARASGISNIVEGDIEELDRISIPEPSPDVILATEVLEHLTRPGKFLRSVKAFFSPETEMVITTPNCFAAHRFLYPLLGREVVHSEHVAYHSFSTLTNLISRSGFRIVETYGYVLPVRRGILLGAFARAFPHSAAGYIFVVRYP